MSPFAKTFASIRRAKLFGLLLACAVLAISLVLMAAFGITWLTARIVHLERGWLDTLVNWVVGAVAGIGGWFMLPVLGVLIAGIFQEVVIRRVEQVDYPEVAGSGASHFWADAGHDLLFTLRALMLNLLVMPLYFLGIGFVVSIVLNSYLLGREFFIGAAGYHLGKPEAALLARKHRKTVYGGGLVITLLTLAPVLNLFMPIFATVWMVHAYHGLRQSDQAR